MLKESDIKGIDINALTSKGSTAFHIACCHGKLEIVKLLVGEPKTQNQLNANKNQGTGFIKACYFGQYEIVAYLLEDADAKGIEIKSSNHKGGLNQGQLQEWTEHSHTDLPKSETSRDIKKSF